MRSGLPPSMLALLEGIPYQVVERRRHRMLVIDGRGVLVLPRASRECSGGRQAENALAALRRFLRSRASVQ